MIEMWTNKSGVHAISSADRLRIDTATAGINNCITDRSARCSITSGSSKIASKRIRSPTTRFAHISIIISGVVWCARTFRLSPWLHFESFCGPFHPFFLLFLFFALYTVSFHSNPPIRKYRRTPLQKREEAPIEIDEWFIASGPEVRMIILMVELSLATTHSNEGSITNKTNQPLRYCDEGGVIMRYTFCARQVTFNQHKYKNGIVKKIYANPLL